MLITYHINLGIAELNNYEIVDVWSIDDVLMWFRTTIDQVIISIK